MSPPHLLHNNMESLGDVYAKRSVSTLFSRTKQQSGPRWVVLRFVCPHVYQYHPLKDHLLEQRDMRAVDRTLLSPNVPLNLLTMLRNQTAWASLDCHLTGKIRVTGPVGTLGETHRKRERRGCQQLPPVCLLASRSQLGRTRKREASSRVHETRNDSHYCYNHHICWL